MREQAGLDLSGVRGTLLAAALTREAHAGGLPDGEAVARALLEGARPLAPFIEELTVGETWFFREPAQWAFIEEVVLPEGLRRREGGVERFRAWSAGCSTGEEPYTLAIVLHDRGVRERVHLVGTDLNETALARARRGEYSLWSLRGAADGRARRHLTERDGRFLVAPEIAARVRFFPLNLARPEYPSAARGLSDLDLVLCRNVLMYLDRAHVAEAAGRLFETLTPGGWLLTGAADPPLGALTGFTVRAGPFGVAYQRPVAPSSRTASVRPTSARRVAPRDAAARTLRPPPPPGHVPPIRSHRAAPPGPPTTLSRDPELAAAHLLVDAAHLTEALAAVDDALARRPLDAEAHFEKAVVLTELGRLEEAADACRRARYLSRGQPFVHFFTGLLRLRRGDTAGASRALRTAASLAQRMPAAAPVRLSHGMTAGALVEGARFHLSRLAGDGPSRP
ncbi:protein-glutamate O-methyltransferase CheR [Anaeromyxobacter sp. Fw109-5]|uniref:CheR family methyltransferase n=1 Tax=Anaeromyxobacter sp. (strain Fw109-5) TaxID=404589 RepID=UPI00031DA4DB|nr:protein-glutamate O-methyltransferase CheR [Anaeromyxobacter sp. Fw109-5]